MSVLSLTGRCPLLELRQLPQSWDVDTIDLSGLEWVTPFDVAALASIWTRLSHRGQSPRVILPSANEVRGYLVDIGLSTVIPGDWGSGGGCLVDPPWLQLTRLESGDQWDDMASALRPSAAAALGDVKLMMKTLYIMSELIDNAASHGRSASGTFVCSQRYTGATSELSPGVWIGIADSGIGIPTHLRRNPKYEKVNEDTRLIGLARRPSVTGTTDNRGWGLVEVFEDAAEVGPSRVVIRSGRGEGNFRLSQGVRVGARYRTVLPELTGTWIHVLVGGT